MKYTSIKSIHEYEEYIYHRNSLYSDERHNDYVNRISSIYISIDENQLCAQQLYQSLYFNPCKNLKYASFESNITAIPNNCFEGCYNLEEVHFSSSVSLIGEDAFRDCYSLTSIPHLNNIVSLKDHAFYGCQSLQQFQIPTRISSIECGCFAECYNIVSISIPKNIKFIGDEAFNKCLKLKTIYFEDVNSITFGNNVFLHCLNLTEIKVPLNYALSNQSLLYNLKTTFENVLKINNVDEQLSGKNEIQPYEFYFSNLRECIISPNIHKIGRSAFEMNTALSSISIPSDVSCIDDAAFRYCKSLEYVELPKNLRILGNGVFDKCCLLKHIAINSTYLSSIPSLCFYNCRSLKDIVIPENVLEICESAFDKCDVLENVCLPMSLKKIGPRAFANCKKLNSIKIPSHIEYIDVTAFKNNNKNHLNKKLLINVVEQLSSLEYLTNKDDFKDIVLSNELDDIPVQSAKNENSCISYGRIQQKFYQYSDISSIVIDDSVSAIGRCAFYGCKNLLSVYLPKSIKIIDDEAFKYCEKLEYINLLNDISVGNYAFLGCISLSRKLIPDNIASGVYSFAGTKL